MATAITLPVVGVHSTIVAQCTQIAPGSGVPGVTQAIGSVVLATCEWDPDGAGPLPQVLVVGGAFQAAGNIAAANVAAFDPISATWSPLGSGTNGIVRSLAVLPNGDLVAGGTFSTAGGVAAANIARWNGTAWAPLGAGITFLSNDAASEIWSLAVQGSDLIAGGWFNRAGGVVANNIARWNGTAWSPFGLGANGVVATVTAMPNGDLVIGGAFQSIDTTAANFIARLTPTGWTTFGSGASGMVYNLRVASNGDLIAVGTFTAVAGVPAARIARWNGSTWTALGSGIVGSSASAAYCVAELPNGDLVAGGRFAVAGGSPATNVARWNGSTWSSLGAGVTMSPTVPEVWTVAAWATGDAFVGGRFTTAGSGTALNIARFDGAQWFALATGTDGAVNCFTTKPNGNVVAGGSFGTIGGTHANRIAEWNGSAWSQIGAGVNGSVLAVASLPNGDIVAGGRFTVAGSSAVQNIARWDGTSWTPLGTGVSGPSSPAVLTLLVMPSGDVIAGGTFDTAGGVPAANVARWDGAAWSALGSNLSSSVMALTMLPAGDLIAGGFFTASGPNPLNGIARWNGTTWVSLGTGLASGARTLAVLPNGNLVAGGFTATNMTTVQRWDGAVWQALGTGMNATIFALAVMPGGDVVASGASLTAAGTPATRFERWNGSTWAPFGSGIDSAPFALMVHPRGELFLGGAFSVVDGTASPFVARYVSTCVATSTTNGAGCGTNVLTATTPPWVDATFRARGTGLPTTSIVLALTSFASIPQGTAPLASFFGGLSPAGCDLLVGPDIVETIVTTNGIADSQLFLPNTPPLVGLPFFHQMVPVAIDPSLAVLSITATNSLRLVAGDF